MGAYALTPTSLVKRTSDGAFIPNDPNNKDWQAYQAWLAAGNAADPLVITVTPQQEFAQALAAGINTIWTLSGGPDGSLNGTYAIDQQSLFNFTAETVTILTTGNFSTGGTTRYWLNQAGAPMPMNIAQFKALAMAVSAYVDGLYEVLAANLAGGNVPWPSNLVTIDA
jgi:hypothetical protein